MIATAQELERLKTEGQEFLDNYKKLDDSAMMSVIAYMRGLKDGKLIAEKEERKACFNG